MAMSWQQLEQDLEFPPGHPPEQAAHRDVAGTTAISDGQQGIGRQKGRAVESALFKPFLYILHFGTNYPMPAVIGGN